MTFDELELEEHLSPQDKLEYVEFQKLTSKFCNFCKRKEQKDLTKVEIFELVSDNLFYQEIYKRIISENDTKEALRVFLSTDLSLLENKKIHQLARGWKII